MDAALLDVIEAEDAHYMTLWDSLTRAQRALVQALASEPTPSPYAEQFRSRHQLGSAATVQRATAERPRARRGRWILSTRLPSS